MAFGKDNNTMYDLNHSLRTIFVTGSADHLGYDNITTPDDFWIWLRHEFVDTVYGRQNWNDDKLKVFFSVIKL